MKAKRRVFATGSQHWKSAHDSADGRNVTIEIPSKDGIVKMTVRKQPLQLVPVPKSVGR